MLAIIFSKRSIVFIMWILIIFIPNNYQKIDKFKIGIQLNIFNIKISNPRYLHSIPQSEFRFIRPHESSLCIYIYINVSGKITNLLARHLLPFDSISLMRPSKLYINSIRAFRCEKCSPRRFYIIYAYAYTFVRYYRLALIRVIIDGKKIFQIELNGFMFR